MSHRSHPRQNIELKARLDNWKEAVSIARRLATEPSETQHQLDTYFRCRHGRLKLRQINGQTAELISYHRPNSHGARTSRYYIMPVSDPSTTRSILETSLGVLVTVEKQRQIERHKYVRIHLDQVYDLGAFLEFEAVLGPQHGTAEAAALVDWLRTQFGIREENLIAGSYSDRILERLDRGH